VKLTLITPHIGRKRADEYVHTWQMEPLPMATLAGMTPPDVEVAYFDERIEPIDFDAPTDLVGIAVETYTAKRAYEIAAEYHRRGVRTILGGYHVMLLPDEAARYADSILVGYAEPLWERVLRDAERGTLQPRYVQNRHEPYAFSLPRRDLFAGKPYFELSCVETGRGCPLHCNFCSIAAATGSSFLPRPIDSIVAELETLTNRTVFFVDDNFVSNHKRARELCKELIPLKLKWVGQGTLTMARDERLLALMAESGCIGMLIGFESLNAETLLQMDKKVNTVLGEYPALVDTIHSYGISIYGTFIFGYDLETPEDGMRTVDAAIDLGLGMGAFNHLLPFPGTPLYAQLREEGRLTDDEWWLSPTYRYGDISFEPRTMTGAELHALCLRARRRFYGFPSIGRRLLTKGNRWPPRKAGAVLGVNLLLRKEIDQKDGLPLGNEPFRPVPRAGLAEHAEHASVAAG
jgi:radical SAM superfamily enzyme YgiQ (UPF0313 family)